ncbi:MAG: TylF/MycF/NovP-related O-methyltransferase, partial [Geminicoccales bacterium]
VSVKIMRGLGINKVAARIYYNYIHGFDTATKFLVPALERCFHELAEAEPPVSGDYMEFGLFKGYSFWYAQQVAQRLKLDSMRFFGFDSFVGLPEPKGIDATQEERFYQGQFACSRATVEQNLDAHGVDWDRTFLIEGFFADSLTAATRTTHGMKRVALALIDCDLYESTVEVLEFLAPMVGDGSILIFDDWNSFGGGDDKGQRRALRQFLAANQQLSADPLFAYGHYGQVFVLRHEAGEPS